MTSKEIKDKILEIVSAGPMSARDIHAELNRFWKAGYNTHYSRLSNMVASGDLVKLGTRYANVGDGIFADVRMRVQKEMVGGVVRLSIPEVGVSADGASQVAALELLKIKIKEYETGKD